MFNYQITPTSHTETALNCNVTRDEQHLGQMYIFPTDDPNLKALGIEKEWFLAPESGNFVVSGHINTVGEWCVSPHRSLAPSLQFGSQAKVFDRVFGPDYAREVLASRSQVLEAVDSPASRELEETLGFQASRANEGGDEDEEGEFSSQFTVHPTLAPMEFAQSIPNLDVLTELLRASLQEELEEASVLTPGQTEREEVAVEEIAPPTLLEIEVDERSDRLDFIELASGQVSISDFVLRIEIQETIIDRAVGEYRERETTEFLLPPFGSVTVHAEEDYFVLRSESDGRTILAATLDGEVLDGLDGNDAALFDLVLQQSEVELFGLVADEAELLEQDTETEVVETERASEKFKGFEYGD